MAPKPQPILDDSDFEEEEAQSIDSELYEFDPAIPEVGYQIIHLKSHCYEGRIKDKLLKIDCRSGNKPLMSVCFEMLCKKQQPMMF
jgi:hypothetical protein